MRTPEEGAGWENVETLRAQLARRLDAKEGGGVEAFQAFVEYDLMWQTHLLAEIIDEETLISIIRHKALLNNETLSFNSNLWERAAVITTAIHEEPDFISGPLAPEAVRDLVTKHKEWATKLVGRDGMLLTRLSPRLQTDGEVIQMALRNTIGAIGIVNPEVLKEKAEHLIAAFSQP